MPKKIINTLIVIPLLAAVLSGCTGTNKKREYLK